MSQTFKLYRLQLIDSQLDHVRVRLIEIDKAMSNDENLRQALQMNDVASHDWQAARKASRQAEDAVLDQRVKIEQIEATLYSGKVHNPKELQDMQKEVAALKRFRSVLEDRQLEAMILEEEKQAAYQEAARQLDLVKQQSGAQQIMFQEEQVRMQREGAHLEEERLATASTIPDQELQLYEQLRKQRMGIAVAKVADRACSACGSVLSTALLAAARTPSMMARCETCGRILYAG